MNRKAQLGFGLGVGGSWFDVVGMPIVVIVVIAFIAYPAYMDYRALARVAQGIESVATAKAAVEKAFAAKGPADMSQSAVTGWKAPAPTEYLQSAAIGKGGTITLRFAESVATQGQNELQIVPVSGGKAMDLSLAANAGRKFEWQCGGPAGKTTIVEQHRPKNCR
jgi:Tfp pilus assembly protein PilE